MILALISVLMCFASCGGAKETETESETVAETGSAVTETEDPRQSVKVDLPADLSFANAADNTFTFFIRDDKDLWKYEMDVDELTNDTLWDAIYERNAKIENQLGVTITTISQPGAYDHRDTWNATLRNAVNTKSGDFDAAAIYMSTGSALALEGMYYNLIDFPNITLSKPWWNQVIQKETTLFDSMYYLAGDIAISEVAGGQAIFFNKKMFEELYPGEDLYQVVWDGQWTIDKMYEYIEAAWEDTNSSGEIDNGDTVGFNVAALESASGGSMDSWIPAMGLRVTEHLDGIPILSFYNERSVAAFEKVQKLHADCAGTLPGGPAVNPDSVFEAGKALFARAALDAGSGYREMTDPYGVIPMPKFDEEQEGHQTSSDNTVSLVVVLSSVPAEKTELVGATLEHMAAGSYKEVTPAYYEIVLKSKYSNDPRDAEMYEYILGTFVYTFGFIYSTFSIAGVGNLFRVMTGDFAQQYEANATKYETALETLIDKLEEISYNATVGG